MAANLPASPPTFAVCGATDWRVALTEPDGRKLHVECWKAEREAALDGHKARAEALSNTDGVARTPEAIAAVGDAAERMAPAVKAEQADEK